MNCRLFRSPLPSASQSDCPIMAAVGGKKNVR
jgi:hypothetical protein